MTTMRPTASRSPLALSRSGALCAALVFAGLALSTSGAFAQSSCQGDFEKLAAARNARIAAINALQKKGKGKLDPIAACPKLTALSAAENAMLSYMEKNKQWCGIPDNVIEEARKGSARTRQFAGQACGMAAKFRKMQAEAKRRGAQGGLDGAPQRPSLPTGPL